MTIWYCIRTATRQEHNVVEGLKDLARERKLAIEVYLPCETRWNRLTRVKTAKQVPMLPGYLFARVDVENLWRVERVDGVYQILGWKNSEAAGIGDFVSELRTAQEAGAFDHTQTPAHKRLKLEKGEMARVSGGQFTGFIAEIVEKRGADRVKALVTIFGRTGPAIIPIKDLEVLPPEEVAALHYAATVAA